MSNKSSASSQVISLPKGGGAQHGIGEKFSPDLHTGTGNFTVPIALPPGRNGFQPQLNLVYSTGSGNGLFGLGWSLSIPGVSRKTSKGVPRYDDEKDTFILSGAEDLVRVGLPSTNQTDTEITTRTGYRPRTEGLFARIEHCRVVHKPTTDQLAWVEDYWEVRSKDGLVSYYGTPGRPNPDQPDPAALAKPDDAARIFAWKLTRTEDPFGNRIEYEYEADRGDEGPHRWNQPQLKQIRYADYVDSSGEIKFLVTVTFNYEPRLDPFSEYRPGFEIRTTQRCREIVIETHADADRKVRTYQFVYQGDTLNGVSLINQIRVVGHEGDKNEELPPLEFGYTRFEPQRRDLISLQGNDLPPRSLANPDTELVDLFGNGLPDILEMNGTARYWRNLGAGQFDLPRIMRDAPPYSLADSGVQMIDADGNGLSDLLVTTDRLAGYYPLRFGGLWDRKSFHPYQTAPSFNLKDPEVKLVDLDGNGVTDAIRSGSRLECFFNDPDDGWKSDNTKWVERRTLTDFPNINFSDSRVKWADLSGDGLQDIVLVYDGNIEYWPNLGRGNWGARVSMRHCPRFPYGYDPKRTLIGDVDGDGLAELVYVDDTKVTLWINQSGNSWSDPIEILGTPPVSDMDAVRLVDLLGTGVGGVLWSMDVQGNGRPHMYFLDFTGCVKPYVLNEMDNHMGATTRVQYAPSTKFYLEDQKMPATRWQTSPPFPVQVVARVEVIDELSKGKLTTEYRYHHGYWDGAEHEFRGFGSVEQFDTETFDNYNAPGLHGEAAFFTRVTDRKHFSPPTLTKTWFHQGPVGDEFGEWEETDFSGEFWPGDPQVLTRPASMTSFLRGLPRRVKRDALRTLRGSILRTELYALDGTPHQDRPYTVTESLFGVREESKPEAAEGDRLRIFFPHVLAQRTTQWERGDDPLTQFTFTSDYDEFGRPRQQTVVSLPRRKANRRKITGAVVGAVDVDETRILTTHTRTDYAIPDPDVYLHDRVAQVRTFELAQAPDMVESNPGDLGQVLADQAATAQGVHRRFQELLQSWSAGQPLPSELHLIGHTLNHYDGVAAQAFLGRPAGQVGPYGALTRSETLVFTDIELDAAYGDRRPTYLGGSASLPSRAPTVTAGSLGYRLEQDASVGGSKSLGYHKGYYADTRRQRFDFQEGNSRHQRGVVIATQDPLGHQTAITPDSFWLLPERVTDARGLEILAEYDYRVMQPRRVTDPNENRTQYTFTPLGLLDAIWVQGKGGENIGDVTRPSTRFEYNFAPYVRFTIPLSLQSDLDGGLLSSNLRQMFQRRELPLAADATVESLDPGRAWLIRSDKRTFMLDVEDGQIAVSAQPISVHTLRQVCHDSQTDISPPERDKTIETREYSDGFGRLIQARTQAEELVFGESGDDVGLPAKVGDPLQPARGQRVKDRVVVSGWQVYDNKGRVVEKYEPFFAQGWNYQPEAEARRGQHATLFYDPRGKLVRTVNPDGSEQRVIYGIPHALENPDDFSPTPWETYTYDPNDLAPLSHPPGHPSESLAAFAPTAHHYTPASAVRDALGHVICQVERNGPSPDPDWYLTRSHFDARGNLLEVIDTLGRSAFRHAYDLLNNPLRVASIDAGARTSVLDAAGNLVEYRDSKGSLVMRQYDELNRLTHLWARDDGSADSPFTLRERVIYGDDTTNSGLTMDQARERNLLGRPYRHYDEAGLLQFDNYDFKGNLLDKTRQVIGDTALRAGWTADWNVSGSQNALDPTPYQTRTRYDALNRPLEIVYPQGVSGQPPVLKPTYNRAGALEKVELDGAIYVAQIAYNAKGQRTLIAYGNGVMTRYAYDPLTFRLVRLRTEYFAKPRADPDTWTGTGAPLQDFLYRYDLAGNIISLEDHTPNSGVLDGADGKDLLARKFLYDPLYRLTRADGRACKNTSGMPPGLEERAVCGYYDAPYRPGPSVPNQDNAPFVTEPYAETYEYDPAGNMLKLRYAAQSTQWTREFGLGELPPGQWQNAPNNRLTSVAQGNDTSSYQYDESGNLTRQNAERTYTWDHADRLAAFRCQACGSNNASIEARYLYGVDGMRVKKWVRTSGTGEGESTVYIDGVFEHYTNNKPGPDNVTNDHLHVMDNQQRIALLRRGPAHPKGAGPPIQYHLGDHLGSSNVVVSGDGAWINREEYTPYGETSFGSFARKRYRFTGKERDEESGLYYHGARYYAPWLARWVSCDPVGIASSSNSYRFGSGNPLRFIDPQGTQDKPTPEEERARKSFSGDQAICGVAGPPLEGEAKDDQRKWQYIDPALVSGGAPWQEGGPGAALGTILANWLLGDISPSADDFAALARTAASTSMARSLARMEASQQSMRRTTPVSTSGPPTATQVNTLPSGSSTPAPVTKPSAPVAAPSAIMSSGTSSVAKTATTFAERVIPGWELKSQGALVNLPVQAQLQKTGQVTVQRFAGGEARPFGRPNRPASTTPTNVADLSVAQAQKELGIHPDWGNTMEYLITATFKNKLPEGSVIRPALSAGIAYPGGRPEVLLPPGWQKAASSWSIRRGPGAQ